jgi:hypothetical protein
MSLFTERPPSSPPTVSVLISVFAHCTVIALVAAGLLLRPPIIEKTITEPYTLRHLDLHMPDPPKFRPQDAGTRYPGQVSAVAHRAVARQVAQSKPAPQTLIQPKLPNQVLPEKIPLPTVVIWSQENTPTPTIVPPPPQKVTAAVVQPSVQPPNNELNLDRVAVASSPLPSMPQPILPSTTSPVVVLAPQPAQAPPQTTSISTAPPTPTAVVSLSDLRKDGPVLLPPANQTASSSSSGLLAPGSPEDVAQADRGNTDSNNKSDGTAANAKTNAGKGGQGKEQASKSDTDTGTAVASASTGTGTVERINLAKDGQFGVVVVGSSLEEMYPEAAELWSGRLAYTVYVHVGLAKSWILQYSLLPSADAAAGGNAAHLAAPWPYTIIRPNLALGEFNADALMVRGIVNAAGRFEALAVAFPPKFPQAEFVLSSLRQWEFRPATQGGQPTAVEVLLIIPGESE